MKTTHGNENTEDTEDRGEERGQQQTLGRQVAEVSMKMYRDFMEEGFNDKESFELLKLWCGPNFAMIVTDLYDARTAAIKREQGGSRLHIPRPI